MALSENNGDYRLPHDGVQLASRFTFAKLRRRHGFARISRIFFLILIRENLWPGPKLPVQGRSFRRSSAAPIAPPSPEKITKASRTPIRAMVRSTTMP